MILGAGCVVEAAENETRGYGPDGVLSLIVLKERKHQTNQQKPPVNWQYDSVVEYLPSMYKALGSKPNTRKKILLSDHNSLFLLSQHFTRL